MPTLATALVWYLLGAVAWVFFRAVLLLLLWKRGELYRLKPIRRFLDWRDQALHITFWPLSIVVHVAAWWRSKPLTEPEPSTTAALRSRIGNALSSAVMFGWALTIALADHAVWHLLKTIGWFFLASFACYVIADLWMALVRRMNVRELKK